MPFERDWQQHESSASCVVGLELVVSIPAYVTIVEARVR